MTSTLCRSWSLAPRRCNSAAFDDEKPGFDKHEHGPLTTAQIEQLRAGTAVFYVRGVIRYADADGLRHHCTFCRVLGAGQELVAPPQPGYNYGD